MNWLSKLTTIEPEVRWGKETPENLSQMQVSSELKSEPIPVFIHVKSLTFPVLVSLVKGSWEAIKQLPVAWVETVWFPFSIRLEIAIKIPRKRQ
ncbi:MAG: hypothetical protein AAFY16_08240, partial [Cyanobacteria bacterium J06642_3]